MHSVVDFQSTESQLTAKGDADTKDESEETVPNPFSQLTDQELEEYKKEVERKKLELEGKELSASGSCRVAGRAWGGPETEQSRPVPGPPPTGASGLSLASAFTFNASCHILNLTFLPNHPVIFLLA